MPEILTLKAEDNSGLVPIANFITDNVRQYSNPAASGFTFRTDKIACDVQMSKNSVIGTQNLVDNKSDVKTLGVEPVTLTLSGSINVERDVRTGLDNTFKPQFLDDPFYAIVAWQDNQNTLSITHDLQYIQIPATGWHIASFNQTFVGWKDNGVVYVIDWTLELTQ